MADEIIIETTSTQVIEVSSPGPQGPAGAAGTGLETLTSKGDTLYRGDTTGERLPIGTTGQILRVSASGIPEWGAAPASGVSSVSGKTGAVSLDSTDIFTEQALQISDAGTADCNGVFIYGGLFNGRPTYYATKDTFVYWDGLNWVINHNGGDQYFGTATTYAWQAVWSLGAGANPLPVVAQAASHEFEQVVGQRTNPTSRGDAAGKNVGTGANDVAAGNHTHSSATQSVAGFLSAADKTKLDGIASGATANTPSNATPSALGTAAAGTSANYARADHVHALPNASALLSTGADEGDLPVAQGDGTVAWQNGTTWATLNITAADVGAAAVTHASAHASGGSDPLTPSSIGAQSIFASDSASAAVSGAPLQLSSARAKTWTLENVHSNRDVYLPVTGIQAGDVAVLIGGGNVTYTLTVKVPAAGGAAIIDPENTPNSSPVVISATGQQFRFIVTNPSSFNPWRFVSVDTHTHPASAISDSTTAGRALLTAADAPAQRTSLGLGTAATSATGDFAAASHSHELTALAATGATNGHVLTANGSGGVTFAAASGGGVTATASSASDVLGVSGANITGVDAGAADRLVFWDDSANKLTYLEAGSGLSISGTTITATGSGISTVGASTADVLSVSGSDLVADDGGTIDSSDPFIKWDDAAGKLVYANPLSRPSGAMYVGLSPSTTALGSNAINIQSARNGATNVASGSSSICIGTGGNTASGQESVSIGVGNAVSALRATAVGYANTASGQESVSLGSLGFASGVKSVGVNETAVLRGQVSLLPFRSVYWGGQTTNNTATILNLDATSTNRFTIAANTALAVDILLVARRSDTADKWLVARRFLGIRRDGSNNTSLIGSVQTLGTDQSEGSPTWTFALTADDTNEALQLEVTGAASETVQWRATAFYRFV